MSNISAYIVPIIIAIAAIVIICVLLSGYVKASPDKAFIISGMRKKPRILIGQAGVKVPFFEKKDELELSLVPVDVKTQKSVPTADYINIMVDANVNVKIGKSEEFIALAAQNFLNKKPQYIAAVAGNVLEGNMREIIGRMRLEEMVSDRQKFAEEVKHNAVPDLAGMGLEIISFNVQNFTDGNGVIENLGVDNVVRIQKNAAISRAESEKEIKVAQASAARESNAAEVAAQTDIASKQNELEIKKQQLKAEADIARAKTDAAYNIQEEEQRKTVETKRVDADIAKQQREIELKKAEAQAEEERLVAEVKKKADADLYRRQKEAEATLIEKQKEAEAIKYQRQQEAEAAKIAAEADKYSKEQEAAGIKAIGEAEAFRKEAEGMAEAKATDAKAEAMKKYGQAAMTEMIMKALPEMAKAIAAPISAIDKLTVIDSGSGAAVGSVSSYMPQILAKTIETVKEATGFDITETMKASTYDAAVNRNIRLDGEEQIGAALGCKDGCENHECTSGHKCPYVDGEDIKENMNHPM